MTREEQIRGALNLYAPSSWDFRGEIMPMSRDELQASHEGFVRGAKWADDNPKSSWIDVKDDLPCNHEEMVKVSIENIELNTDRVLVMLYDGTMDISFMFKPIPYSWRWNETLEITHWMPIPKLKED